MNFRLGATRPVPAAKAERLLCAQKADFCRNVRQRGRCAVSGHCRALDRAGGTRGTDRSTDTPRALQRRFDGPTTVLADVVQRMLSMHATVDNTFNLRRHLVETGNPTLRWRFRASPAPVSSC